MFVGDSAILVEAVSVDWIHSVMPDSAVGQGFENITEFVGITELPHHVPTRGSIEDRFWRTMTNDLTLEYNRRKTARRLQKSDYGSFYSWWTAIQAHQVDNISRFDMIVKLRVLLWQRIFITRDGRMGTGYPQIQPGDEVCVLIGGNMPFVIHPHQAPDTNQHCPSSARVPAYTVIGECYLHGIMDGEALEGDGRKKSRTIALY